MMSSTNGPRVPPQSHNRYVGIIFVITPIAQDINECYNSQRQGSMAGG